MSEKDKLCACEDSQTHRSILMIGLWIYIYVIKSQRYISNQAFTWILV